MIKVTFHAILNAIRTTAVAVNRAATTVDAALEVAEDTVTDFRDDERAKRKLRRALLEGEYAELQKSVVNKEVQQDIKLLKEQIERDLTPTH